MGYPMTYQRVINRNRIADGSYSETPVDWHASGTTIAWSVVKEQDKDHVLDLLAALERHWNEAAKAYNGRITALMGDLRRLEKDTVDEGSICHEIARSTGIDPDDVAAVLKAWIAA